MGEVYKARDTRLDRTVDTGRLHYAEPAWPRRTWRYNPVSASRFNPTAPLAEPDPVSRSRFTFDGRQSGKHGPSL
ncbi:MAG: hypothetical protein KIT09_05355 [Bryobacteraceae bacterium]|nr:hypothetical protein [Bryobacteraceae bacterium]